MQKIFRCLLAFAVVAAVAAPAVAGELKLTMNNGLVTVIADEVPVSRILAEWARVGQTKIVNGEKMMMVVSLQLVDVPERKALEIILRSASGFMAAERETSVAGASAFDRIMILPYSRPPAASALPPTNVPQPFVSRPVPMVPQPQQDEDSGNLPLNPEIPHPNGPQLPNTNMTRPAPGMLPVPGGQMPGQQQPVLTSPRPGQLPPPGPQQPVPFGSPAAPPKKPGGGGDSGGQ